ncbi:MAG: trigger factor [Muribaculaceae bacterium]|nr:trigger factor [Muribaculaceae bacterium]MBQ7854033.1 trigger factor [Muribaculaceae bacterium]
MNVSIEKIDNVNGKITVSIEENDYKDKVTSELKRIGKTHTLPGFRKGHVTIDQLRRRFGKQVKSDVINQEVYEAVINYIRDNKLAILGEPLPVEVKEIDMNSVDYTFEYEIGLTPEINVDLKKVSLPYYNIEVSKEMVDEQDANFRERFGNQVPGEEVDEKALVKGSIMELNEDGSVKDTEDAIQVVGGIIAPMYLKDKEEADKFIGKKLNDKVVFNPYKACEGDVTRLASMLNIDKEKAAEAKGDFEMSIAEIIVVKPAELNEEYYKNIFGPDKVKTEEEYFEAIKQMISAQISGNSEMLFHMQAEKQLVEEYGNFELPQEFLKKWLVRRNEGLTAENIDEEFEKMIPSLKWQLIKERIAAVAEVKIEEADVQNHAKAIARQQFAQYGMTNVEDDMLSDYAKRILEDKNSRSRIIEEAGDAKLFEAIKQTAKIEAKSVSVDEFKSIAEKA